MSAPVAEGDVLAGKYRIERVLGQGGMGVVVAAMHQQLNQRVAIKLLLEGATAEVVERFQREARAAVRLKCQHVARVIDVGELPNGAPYMVMEYLEGNDLSQIVRASGALSVHEAVLYLLHACEAIGEAHSIGIIHRDLKPANLFLTRAADGTSTVKVLDFGISKTAEAEGAEGEGMSLTKTTAVLGSPLYMSPEQMKSARSADARSDIWSLGAIVYELLTGGVPFNAMTFTELVLMVNMEAPRSIATIRNDVPPGLEAAVLKCLEKKPDNRFANVAELAFAVAPYGPPQAQASADRVARTLEAVGLASTGPRSLRATGAEPATAGSITALSSSAAAPIEPQGRGRLVPIVGAIAAIVVGAAAAFALMTRHPEAPAAADPGRPVAVDTATVAAVVPSAAIVVAPAVTPSAAAPPPAATPTATASAVAARPVAPGKLPAPTAAAVPTPINPPSKKTGLGMELK
ncbi:MAG: serine/threonine-protein kinase [Byssovorax sp.]